MPANKKKKKYLLEVEKMSALRKDNILELQKKLQDKDFKSNTEEDTKQKIILPFMMALGWDPFSDDVEPEYTCAVGKDIGDKVDYALKVDNSPVIFVECKKYGEPLEKHIKQLFNYFAKADIKTAILTNGDDYWFFTDSSKENIMDEEPQLKIKLSTMSENELSQLEQYTKDCYDRKDLRDCKEHYASILTAINNEIKQIENEIDNIRDESDGDNSLASLASCSQSLSKDSQDKIRKLESRKHQLVIREQEVRDEYSYELYKVEQKYS